MLAAGNFLNRQIYTSLNGELPDTHIINSDIKVVQVLGIRSCIRQTSQ